MPVISNIRRQEKVFTTPGQVPTVPTLPVSQIDSWLPTDIMIGELAFNEPDLLWFTRGFSGIYTFPTAAQAQAMQAQINNLTTNFNQFVSQINQDLSDEAAARIAGDAALQAGKQDALGYTPENIANKNQVDGYAGLDGGGKVPAALLPGFVDDVLEFATTAGFPVTGEAGILYVAQDTGKIYRWATTVYVEISPAPGSTDEVAEGSVNKYFTTARVLATVLTGLSLVTGTPVTSSDTILVGIGKLQKQITDLITSVAGKVAKAGDFMSGQLTVTNRIQAGLGGSGGDLLAIAGGGFSGGFQMWKDGSASAAANIGMSRPGDSPTNDLIFSSYSPWTERARLTQAGLWGVGVAPTYRMQSSQEIAGGERSTDPVNPGEGKFVVWMSDGSGSGDDGDIMVKITAGAVTKTATLVDFSTL